MATPQQQGDMVRGEAAAWGCIFGYVDTMALRCALKLGIPDIISSHGRPISLTQITDSIPNHPSSLDTAGRLSRVMSILVRRGIFSASPSESSSGAILYGLTAASELLLSSSEDRKSLAAMAMYHSSEFFLSLWQEIDDCVKDGSGTAFTRRCGMDAWSYMSANPEDCTMFHQSMAGMSRMVMEALRVGYLRDGLEGVGSLVDVGGGSGTTISEIVRELPRIKGINFDLPFVVAASPEYPGVTHVAGDMFISVPLADAILIKWTWSWTRTGTTHLTNPFDHTKVAFDLTMMVRHGAKERTEGDWKTLLQGAGFSHYKIVKIPTFISVIEAYP